jgi:hypothetical protein
MDFATFTITVATVIIHALGIGGFLVWFAAGRPMSKRELQRWWKEVHFIPDWMRLGKGGTIRRL